MTQSKIMNKIDILHSIPEDKIDKRRYFLSLLELANSCGLLSNSDVARIQSELALILAEQADKYTNGESSSITSEKANELLTSVMYVIGLHLKLTYKVPEQAVEHIKANTVKSVFESGLATIERRMEFAKHLHKLIASRLFETPNIFYRSTAIDGINGFFKLYRPQFAAHEIHITADYPLCSGMPELDGIEFIEQYLLRLECENAFCTLFSPDDVHRLMLSLSKDYTSCPVNIFEPVLLCVLGLTLLGANPMHLNLTPKSIDRLYCIFNGKTRDSIIHILKKALAMLSEKINLPRRVKKYAAFCIPKLAPAIENALNTKSIDKVFIMLSNSESNTKIMLSYGERMSDAKYTKLLEKLQQVHEKAKIKLIIKEVHSLADLLDVLSDAEFTMGELEVLVDMLPQNVFAALLSKYPDASLAQSENEQMLCVALQKKKESLSPQMRKEVQDQAASIYNETFD